MVANTCGLVKCALTSELALSVALALFSDFGNAYYLVDVDEGRYTAQTGDSHPVTISTGERQNVLYGDGIPNTSYMTIRSYTSGTDYIDTGFTPNSGLTVRSLEPYESGAAFGSTGVRTEWDLPGGQTTPDDLTVVQLINVVGTTLDNSAINDTTTITNNGAVPVSLGIRYLWDWQIAGDDGPSFAPVQPDGPAVVTEQTYNSPNFTAYGIQDNNGVDSPLFVVYGSADGPATISPEPTNPDVLKYVSWADAVDEAFDYTTSPSHDVASPAGDDDSATLYYWGPDSDHAIVIAPGDSVTVSAALFAGEPGEPPPILNTPTPGAATSTPTATRTPGTPESTITHRRTATPTTEPTDTPAPPTATSKPVVVLAGDEHAEQRRRPRDKPARNRRRPRRRRTAGSPRPSGGSAGGLRARRRLLSAHEQTSPLKQQPEKTLRGATDVAPLLFCQS